MDNMLNIVAGLLILVGGSFSLIAAIGVLRLPDVLIRMHAATKAGTMGGGLILLATALEAQELEIYARAFAGIVFLLLTAPVSAHLLGRAAYAVGATLWTRTKYDDLEGKYDPDTLNLKSHSGPSVEILRKGR